MPNWHAPLSYLYQSGILIKSVYVFFREYCLDITDV